MKRMTYMLVSILILLAVPLSAQTTYTVVIASGTALSNDVTTPSTCYPSAIQMPAAWTTANLTFQVKLGDEWGDWRDEYGAELGVVVSAVNDVIDLPVSVFYKLAGRTWRVRSGTTGTPVTQAAGRRLIVACTAR